MTSIDHSSVVTLVAGGLCVLLAAYLLVSYVLLPYLWSRHERQPGLEKKPMVTANKQGIPGDPLNVGLVGSREAVLRGMLKAGWHPADPITLRSSIGIGASVILHKPYPGAPVSPLFYRGRREDLAFEIAVGHSANRRHHVRFWLALPRGEEGREVWLGSASFDHSVGLSHDTGQITHHISPDLDAERAFFMGNLQEAGMLVETYRMPGVGATQHGRNGEGDRYFTDGETEIGVLKPELDGGETAPGATTPGSR